MPLKNRVWTFKTCLAKIRTIYDQAPKKIQGLSLTLKQALG